MTLKQLRDGLLRRMPVGKEFAQAYEVTRKLRNCPARNDLGAYQSPIPSLSEIQSDRDRIFALPEELPGIPLNAAGQRALGAELAPFVAECPFPRRRHLPGGITAATASSRGVTPWCCMP